MLQARVAAEDAFKLYKGGDLKKKIRLARDVLLMRLHSDCPTRPSSDTHCARR